MEISACEIRTLGKVVHKFASVRPSEISSLVGSVGPDVIVQNLEALRQQLRTSATNGLL